MMGQLAAGHAVPAHQKGVDARLPVGPLALHDRRHAALAFQQRRGGPVLHVEGEAIVASDAQQRAFDGAIRSEEGRVGKEGVSTCRSRWSPYHSNTQTDTTT